MDCQVEKLNTTESKKSNKTKEEKLKKMKEASLADFHELFGLRNDAFDFCDTGVFFFFGFRWRNEIHGSLFAFSYGLVHRFQGFPILPMGKAVWSTWTSVLLTWGWKGLVAQSRGCLEGAESDDICFKMKRTLQIPEDSGGNEHTSASFHAYQASLFGFTGWVATS